MSWINLGEVHYVVRRAHGEGAAMETVRDLRDVLNVRLPDERTVLDAARIKADHRMAFADAFGAALAIGAAVDRPVHVNDLHATLLHLLGLDHERLLFRFQGRDYRLTDVAGRVVRPWLA